MQKNSISVQFGGNQIDVQIAEGVCDELTGRPIAHDQVVSLEVATDNEAYLLNLMQRSLRESNCRASEDDP